MHYRNPQKRATNEYSDKLYRQHLKRLKHATTRMDTKPARVNIASVMKLGNVMCDIEGFNKIHNYNVALLRSLNEIKVKFFEGIPMSAMYGSKAGGVLVSATSTVRNEALKLAKENKIFAARLEAMRSRNHEEYFLSKSKALKCQVGKCKLPEKVLAKYVGKVSMPQNGCLQFKLLRPSIFFDLEAKNERPIGRVVFQLYTEACPMIVLELVKVFHNKQNQKLKFSRVYPYLWAECDITVNRKNLDNLEYDMHAMDNGIGMGIISVDIGGQSLRCLRYGLLVLVISFKPLSVLNGRRVPIGRITNGRRNLIGLSEYGTKNGKPLKNIVVTQLGIVEN